MVENIFFINLFITLFVMFLLVTLLHESIFVSIFFLIALFLISSFIFILCGFEFIGFLYLIVYVGAVAVLFLFMVMLFDKSEYLFFSLDRRISFKGKIINFVMGLFFAVLVSHSICYFLNTSWLVLRPFEALHIVEMTLISDFMSVNFNNLEAVGSVLYTYYFLDLIGGTFILLIGMVGAIVLTQSVPTTMNKFKHQDIRKQILRKRT